MYLETLSFEELLYPATCFILMTLLVTIERMSERLKKEPTWYNVCTMREASRTKIIRKQKLTEELIFSILRQHIDILRKLSVRKIGLFGSFARGEQRRRSDIDFLVEFEKPTFDNFMDLVFSLEKLLGKKVDIVTQGSLSPYIRPYVEKEVRWCEV
jgi:predicted nucleotidyltransferase